VRHEQDKPGEVSEGHEGIADENGNNEEAA